jgi:hypothetical protein
MKEVPGILGTSLVGAAGPALGTAKVAIAVFSRPLLRGLPYRLRAAGASAQSHLAQLLAVDLPAHLQ